MEVTPYRDVIKDGKCYRARVLAAGERTTVDDGFGGQIFRIESTDGEIFFCTLWYYAEVPVEEREARPDNCRALTEVSPAYRDLALGSLDAVRERLIHAADIPSAEHERLLDWTMSDFRHERRRAPYAGKVSEFDMLLAACRDRMMLQGEEGEVEALAGKLRELRNELEAANSAYRAIHDTYVEVPAVRPWDDPAVADAVARLQTDKRFQRFWATPWITDQGSITVPRFLVRDDALAEAIRRGRRRGLDDAGVALEISGSRAPLLGIDIEQDALSQMKKRAQNGVIAKDAAALAFGMMQALVGPDTDMATKIPAAIRWSESRTGTVVPPEERALVALALTALYWERAHRAPKNEDAEAWRAAAEAAARALPEHWLDEQVSAQEDDIRERQGAFRDLLLDERSSLAQAARERNASFLERARFREAVLAIEATLPWIGGAGALEAALRASEAGETIDRSWLTDPANLEKVRIAADAVASLDYLEMVSQLDEDGEIRETKDELPLAPQGWTRPPLATAYASGFNLEADQFASNAFENFQDEIADTASRIGADIASWTNALSAEATYRPYSRMLTDNTQIDALRTILLRGTAQWVRGEVRNQRLPAEEIALAEAMEAAASPLLAAPVKSPRKASLR